jgi:hypothetical protein
LCIMITYSRQKLHRAAGGSAKRVLLAFKAHCLSSIPKNRWDPLYPYTQKDFDGDSFMLRPYDLINNYFRWTPKEAAQYIGLASFRNYASYRVTGDTTLDLFHSPVDQDNIKQNRLLRIKDDRIHFYYEEDINRRNKLWH